MNLGLGNLTELKAQGLAEALRSGTRYDARLIAVGKGAAAAIEQFCNRKFGRVVGDTYTGPADRTHCILPRYPVESISQVEFKSDETTGFVVQTDNAYVALKSESGIVHFGASLGPHWSQIRITYTGGFWFDETEENNDTLPSGATALPQDVKLAWYLHCQTIWQTLDKLGTDITKTGTAQTTGATLSGLDMSPAVKAMLGQFIRYAMI